MKLKSALALLDAGVVAGGRSPGRDAADTAGSHSLRGNLFLWLRQFVRRQIVTTAPEDIAICEFDCRKTQCSQDEFEACERRIRKGAGELFPKPASAIITAHAASVEVPTRQGPVT
jgi:hypothetical protein